MKKLEYGRSMVEMLGVLAIIGVLSVGAIAGYSKAMLKYKLNKQAQQLSQIINVAIMYNDDWDEKNTGSLIPIFSKLGHIPKEMIIDESNFIYDVFKNRIKVEFFITSAKEKRTDMYVYFDIKDNANNLEVCRNVFITAKEFHADLTSIHSYSTYGTSDSLEQMYFGDKFCSNDCIKDITLTQIDDMCRMHAGKPNSTMKMSVYTMK